jgi:AraC family transcriptional regulator
VSEKGVLAQSRIYFHTASPFAKEALFYLISGGNYVCSKPYEINRDNLPQYLFIYIKSGKMELHYKNNIEVVNKNNLILLDCNEHHIYRALEQTTFDWLHFKGNASSAYFELLYNNGESVISLANNWTIPDYLNQLILSMKHNNVDEHSVSILLHKIFYELKIISNHSQDTQDDAIKRVILYIENHFMENITIGNLAEYAQLSPYHFSRVFKKYTNQSPHQYLINTRITQAKELLYFTTKSINEIAFSCGFNSSAHFITTFKKHTNLSPNQFRKMKF